MYIDCARAAARILLRRGRDFSGDRSGNVALIFGLMLLPLIGIAGAAIDYSQASSVRTALQADLDATTLAASKTAPSQNASQIQSAAQTYFRGIFNIKNVATPTVTATYVPPASHANGSLTVSATATVPLSFMGLFGMSSIDVAGTSTTTWGSTRLRVALALDNTGSMASAGKISALKTAATNLIGQLKSAAVNNGDVYVSIVPFAKVVDIDTTNYAATWLDWTSWDANNQTCTRSGCTAKSHNGNWDGTIMDRNQNYDVTAAAPAATATYFPASQGSSYDPTPVPMLPLTYDWTALTNKIGTMTPTGGTNQPIGLVWAWQSLVQTAPLNAPAEDPNYQYNKVIILLTDGLNTEDRWYGNGSTPSSQVDTRQQTLCDNIKAAGITLYAIQVNTDGDPTSAILQYCASDSSKFFMLTSSSQIVTTFQQIGAFLSKLRISK